MEENKAREGVVFEMGRSGKNETDKKKKKKNENIAEERIKQTYNLSAPTKDQDELKRKREEFAVQLRKKKK